MFGHRRELFRNARTGLGNPACGRGRHRPPPATPPRRGIDIIRCARRVMEAACGGGAAREEALAARGVTQLEAMERLVTTNDPWCCVGSKAALRGRGSRARPISLPVTARLSRYGIA